jgi:hypothetical protein
MDGGAAHPLGRLADHRSGSRDVGCIGCATLAVDLPASEG